MGGMIAVVVLALIMVPVFFVVVLKSAEWIRTRRGPQARAHGRAGRSRHRARAAGLIQPHPLLNHGDPSRRRFHSRRTSWHLPCRRHFAKVPPERPQAGEYNQGSLSMTETAVTIPSAGLKLSGVVHVPDDVRPGERRAAFLVLHGFGSNKSSSNTMEPTKILDRHGLRGAALRHARLRRKRGRARQPDLPGAGRGHQQRADRSWPSIRRSTPIASRSSARASAARSRSIPAVSTSGSRR